VQKNKKALPVLAIIILSLIVCQEAALNLANANPQYQPPVDTDYYYIKSDGSVSPATAPIQRQGTLYTLTSNITGHPIGIKYDGAVLDGAGYTLNNNKTGYVVGVMLECTSSVTVKNLRVEGFNCGINIQRKIFEPSPYSYEPNQRENPYPKSRSNTIIECTMQNNGIGILLEESTKNLILNNTIRGNGVGIKLERFYQEPIAANMIQSNLIENNGEGILLQDSSSNTITTNRIIKNSICGLDLSGSSSNAVHYNLIAKNEIGIFLYGSPGNSPAEQNTINRNQIIKNNQWGIRLNGSQTNNKIYANNFIDNNLGRGLQVSIPMYMAADGKVYSGRSDVWSENSSGNYWSDYQTRYPNATENAGVWDNPFYINENNIDQHPLTGPLTLETPMLEQEPVNVNTPTSPPYTAALAILAACVVAVACLFVYRKRNRKVT
jgi:parallel beta-helix repeat protein